MIISKLFKLSLFILVLTCSSIFAATYYVDAVNGNDSNDGTSSSTAWKSLSKVNSKVYLPGDNIYFKRGQQWQGMLVPSTSGTSSARITFGAYGDGARPIITTMQIIPNSDKTGSWSVYSGNIWKMSYSVGGVQVDRLWLSGKEYINAGSPSAINSTDRWSAANNVLYVYASSNPATFYSGVVFSGGMNSNTYTVKIDGKDYVTLENLDLTGGYVGTIGLGGADYITIQDCNVGYGSFGRGIIGDAGSLGGSDATTDHVIVTRCTFDSGWNLYTKYDRAVMDGISIQNGANYWEVSECYFKNWGHSSIQIYGITASTNYNKIYKCVFTAPDISYGRAFETVGTDSNMCRFNEFFRNRITYTKTRSQIGGYRNKIYYNIFDHMVDATVAHGGGTTAQAFQFAAVAGPCKYNKAYNNTIYSTTRYGIWDSGTASEIINNLIVETGSATNGISLRSSNSSTVNNAVWKNNYVYVNGFKASSSIVLFKDKGYTIDGFNALNGTDGHRISGNTQHVGDFSALIKNASNGDFSPSSNSCIINKGINVGLKEDYYGNAIVGNPDIGAVESGSLVNTDLVSPKISNAVILSSTSVKITFSEKVNSSYAQDILNYSIDNSIKVSKAVLNSNQTDVVLTTSQHAVDTKYIIKVNNVKDLAGNAITSSGNSFEYIYSKTVASSNGTTSNDNTLANVPSQFELKQNFPNPFNPTTRIKYAISQATNVTIKIYDMLGAEVMTLVNGSQTPGFYEVSFDGSNLASGTYIYQLRTNNFVETKKMMLIK